MTDERPILGITMGDPYGIGPEIVAKTLADASVRARARFAVFGFSEQLGYALDAVETDVVWHREHHEDVRRFAWDVTALDFDEFAAPAETEARANIYGGRASSAFVEAAVAAAQAGAIDALATAPISKTAWKLAGVPFPGHTELLAKRTNTRHFAMMFVTDTLKVVLATIHEPLLALRDLLTIGCVFNPIDLAHDALKRLFGIEKPRIAVCGLNPHAGEDGRFGDEEKRVIAPAILMAAEAGINVSGPYPADTLFARAVAGQFECVIAMYHDQGLSPVKLLGWRSAVNLTLGLPFIRTSPGHGTAFDIAGLNRADPAPMTAAVKLAIDLAARPQPAGRRKRAGRR